MDRSYSRTKVGTVLTGDVVLFQNPFVTKTVVKSGWYYSQHFDKNYFRIDFADGTEYHSDDGQECIFVSKGE